MPSGASTPAIAAKRLAAVLSNARFEDAEPDPVNGNAAHFAHRLQFAVLRPAPVQAEHQHAIFGFRFIERRFQRDAAIAGLELVLERPLVIEQGFRLHLVHGVGDVPEPEIRLRQGAVQRLRARHRDQPLLVGAAEENGNPHQPCPLFVIPGWSEGPTRNLEFRVDASHRPGMTTRSESRSA